MNRAIRQVGEHRPYFDGSTERGEALIVAGYLQSVDNWLDFSQDWADLLTLPPRMRAFKMSSIRPAQMERAMFHYRATERSRLVGIGIAIPMGPLRKVVRELNLEPALTNPYYLAWRAVITLSLEGAKMLGSRDPIEFVFDDQSEKTNILKAWDYFHSGAPASSRKRIRGISFRNDEDVLPLQAADMIAWWAREQYIKDKTKMKDIFPTTWTGGTDPTLLFAVMPEEGIRKQLSRDLENIQARKPDFTLRASFKLSR